MTETAPEGAKPATAQPTTPRSDAQPQIMGQSEFVALMAMMAATVAFSIDAMLPALAEMGAQLSPMTPDRASLVVSFFVAGMGLGTFFAGPLSDAFGRKPVMLAGVAVYIAAAAVAALAQSLEALLIARLVQGLGASGPRVVMLATVRDLYEGREMARIMSFVMVVFTLVPVMAPVVGAGLVAWVGWRGVFVAFILFAATIASWMALRLAEPLAVADRRPMRLATMWDGIKEMWGIEMVRLSILVQTLSFGMLFSILSTTVLVFDQTFDMLHSFHWWFGGISLVAGLAGFLNARLVRQFGMRPIVMVMLGISASYSLIVGLTWGLGWSVEVQFWAFILWQTMLFFQAGMTIGNLNALAMEPVGHIAGLAASVVGAVATVGAALLSVPVGLLFDGTPRFVALAMAIMAALGFALTLRMRRLDRVVRTA